MLVSHVDDRHVLPENIELLSRTHNLLGLGGRIYTTDGSK
jgi:hypothetical protein